MLARTTTGSHDGAVATVSRLRLLIAARGLDQGVLAICSLVVALRTGVEAFAPIAVLLIINSLAVQLSDFGLGFAVLRTRPGATLATASLRRVRRSNLAVALGAVFVSMVAFGGELRGLVAIGGLLWLVTSEAYVRRADRLRSGEDRRTAYAEGISALALLVFVLVAVSGEGALVLMGAALIARHMVEMAVLGGRLTTFSEHGSEASAAAEWAGQVVTYMAANVDYLVIGALVGPAALSVYVLAFRFASAVPALVGNPVTQMALVDLSRASDVESRDRVCRLVVHRALLLGAFGVLVVAVVASLLALVLGGEWSEVAPVMAVLALAVPARLLLGVTVALAITSGRATRVIRWEVLRVVALACATAGGARWGLGGATVAATAATATSIVIVHLRARHLAGLRFGFPQAGRRYTAPSQ